MALTQSDWNNKCLLNPASSTDRKSCITVRG